VIALDPHVPVGHEWIERANVYSTVLLSVRVASHAVVAFGFDCLVSSQAFPCDVFQEFGSALGADGVGGCGCVHGLMESTSIAPVMKCEVRCTGWRHWLKSDDGLHGESMALREYSVKVNWSLHLLVRYPTGEA
jgi:hypothetical protein